MPERLVRLNALRKKLLQGASRSPLESIPPRPRIGVVSGIVVRVLEDAKQPMHVSDIHSAAEQHLDQPISYRSVKAFLSEASRRPRPQVERPSYGYYRLAGSDGP